MLLRCPRLCYVAFVNLNLKLARSGFDEVLVLLCFFGIMKVNRKVSRSLSVAILMELLLHNLTFFLQLRTQIHFLEVDSLIRWQSIVFSLHYFALLLNFSAKFF